MPKICYLSDSKEVDAHPDKTILQASLENGIPHYYICGGNTRCTTCRVSIVEGLENCQPRNEKEQMVAEEMHFSPAIRLACQTKISGEVKLRRLVMDKDDLAFTSQQIVERVRSEVLAMADTEDFVNIIGVFWEGLQDLGIYTDYCAIKITSEDGESNEVYAAASDWLEQQYGVPPIKRNIVNKMHCYHRTMAHSKEKMSLPEKTRNSASATEAETKLYVKYTRSGWIDEIPPDEKQPKSWMVAPFTYGIINIHSFRVKRFPESTEMILKNFSDAVSLAYARLSDFRRLEQRNQELQKTYRQLQDTQTELLQSAKLASLGRLVSGVAHEINSPLGALKSSIDTYIRSFEKIHQVLNDESIQEELREHPSLSKIFRFIDNLNLTTRSSVERIDMVVSGLRKFSHLDRAEVAEMDVHEGINEALALTEHLFKDRVEVHKTFGEIPKMNAYPTQLNQAFMNLLENANEAIETTGEIFIKTEFRKPFVVIEFRDTGKGIPPEHLSQIFDPGFTTKGVGVGTGMGLSILYKIIQNHRGKVDVESEVGKGTTFCLQLPVDVLGKST